MAAIDRPLDYVVPGRLDGDVRVGSVVRIPLHGRRVRGWVVGRAAEPETDRPLQEVAKVTGWGPPPDLVDLAEWAAWRWAGPRVTFLRAASPPRAVPTLPPPPAIDGAGHGVSATQAGHGVSATQAGHGVPATQAGHGVPARAPDGERMAGVVAEAFSGGAVAVRVPPACDTFAFVAEAARRGDALILTPSVAQAGYVAARLRHAGHAVAVLPRDWARAAAGRCVAVGARAAAWAPRPRLGAVVVVDEHADAYQEERAPTWNARDVAVERARRHRVPIVLTSPCPSLETLATTRLLTLPRADEREGWPVVEIVDRRKEEPGLGLYSSRLVDLVRSAGDDRRVICVLNRRGRARLLACRTCGELARCDECGAVVEEAEAPEAGPTDAGGGLRCRRCGAVRPVVCAVCGSARLRVLRVGVSRVRDDLERLAGHPVAEVTADLAPGPLPTAPVLVGTEAVLHRAAGAAAVAFLDLDQELVAPRWRAGEEALALLARAARVLGGRADGGRLLLQTRLPGHEVVDAVVHADPSRLAVVEGARRVALGFPPERAVAVVSGEAAPSFTAALSASTEVEVVGPADGRWLVRAPDHRTLCDVLAATPRPRGRLRLAVDPLRS